MQRIFVTGMGIVSAIGNNVAETLRSLLEKRSGIAPLRYLQTTHTEYPLGEVKMSDEEMMRRLGIPEDRPVTRTSLMGMLAVEEALASAGCPPADLSQAGVRKSEIGGRTPRIAFINGTTVGGMDKSERFYLDFLENDTKNAYISTHDCGACTEMIADRFGIFSQVDTISTACSSAANAILLGAELLKSGRADIVVAGGAECITKFHLNGFNALMILDKEPCRPFDATRAGLNLGEGAAYLVMETEEHFSRRSASTARGGARSDSQSPMASSNTHPTPQAASGVPVATVPHAPAMWPLCELSGYANACDAFHQTASSPDGEGAYLAMKKALEEAGLQPSDIDYINAHGTGTDNNDLSEGTAIERLFGAAIPPVSSTKSFTGHTTSAAGGVEAVVSIFALQNDFLPANLNFSEKIPELRFAPVTNGQPTKPLRCVLSNSFGFGGNDTSLIFSKI